jgi:type IV pilus assembly protein PilW
LITVVGLGVMTEVQISTDQIKRSTQGTQSAQFSGLSATQLIDQNLKRAGFGFADPTILGSVLNWFDPSTSALSVETLAPVQILADGSNVRLRMMWSTASMNVVPLQLLAIKTSASDSQVSNTYGIQVGDLIAYAEPGKSASLHQASAILNPSLTVQHTVSATYPWNSDMSTVYPTGGYAIGAKAFNLGQWERQELRIQNAQLRLNRRSTLVNSDTILAENVVGFRALYGVDNGTGGTANDGVPDVWSATTPTTSTGWAQVVAVRFAVLTRNKEMERQTVTSVNPSWSGGAFDMTGQQNWGRYRYRVYEGTTVLRNAIWNTPS